MWLGFVALDVPPSPKVQLRDAMVPSLSVLVSVKLAVRSLTLLVKLAVGSSFGFAADYRSRLRRRRDAHQLRPARRQKPPAPAPDPARRPHQAALRHRAFVVTQQPLAFRLEPMEPRRYVQVRRDERRLAVRLRRRWPSQAVKVFRFYAARVDEISALRY